MLSRQEKNQIREEMYGIIANRSILDLNSEELKEVQKLAQLIGSNYIFDSKPLPKMKLENFTVDKCKELCSVGYRILDICRALNISETKFRKWRVEQGIINLVKEKFICQNIVFVERLKENY